MLASAHEMNQERMVNWISCSIPAPIFIFFWELGKCIMIQIRLVIHHRLSEYQSRFKLLLGLMSLPRNLVMEWCHYLLHEIYHRFLISLLFDKVFKLYFFCQ
ncbi:hypothetical protein Droror1_Dr00016905 [Drosera rotundifolia]